MKKAYILAAVVFSLSFSSCKKGCQDCVIRTSNGSGQITETPVQVCEGEPAPAAAECSN